MSQYKKHPIDIALEALAPIIAPSFTLRSVRDGEEESPTYPLVDYVVIGGQGKTRNPGTKQWRSSFFMQLDILTEETKPLDWCQFSELEDAQDRHGLFWNLEEMLEEFITMVVDPESVTPLLKFSDTVYSEFDFRMESYTQTLYHAKKGADKLTGVSGRFVLSAISENGSGCCLIDESNQEQLLKLQSLTKLNSVSWKRIQNLITP